VAYASSTCVPLICNHDIHQCETADWHRVRSVRSVRWQARKLPICDTYGVGLVRGDVAFHLCLALIVVIGYVWLLLG
jgi:hypothetical protein